MTNLVCDNCEPTDPPYSKGYYPGVDVKRVVEGMAEVDADGNLLEHSHEYHEEYLEATCSGCGADLLEQ